MTREEARAAGSTYYDEGRRLCRDGHTPFKRWVSTGKCFWCARDYERERRRSDAANRTALTREWRRLNPEKVKAGNAKRDPVMLRAYAKRWRLQNPEKLAAQIAARDKGRINEIAAKSRLKKWRAKHPGKTRDEVKQERRARAVAAALARNRAWRAANPEKEAINRARYREKHRAELRAKHALYRQTHPTDPLVRRVREARRRARKTKAGGSYTKEDVMSLLRQQKGRCAYCRKDITKQYAVDHIVPVRLGGSSNRSNLQLVCRLCNSSKGGKHPTDYSKSLGLLL